MADAYRRLLSVASFLALAAFTPALAQAGMSVGWWGGNWNCTIDGRPAKMKWSPVDDTQTSCSGGDCTSTSGSRWKGSFSDNGARAVALTNARTGDKGGLFFRHADGNTWYLARPTGNRASGYTTWQGQRYPLSCSR